MGDNDIDVNKIAAEFVQQNIEHFYHTSKDILKGAADSVRLKLSRSYKDYIGCVAGRYSKAKSFFIRDEPTYLYNFYVPMGLTGVNGEVTDASIAALESRNRFVVITGSGGSGKSMMMRHLLLDGLQANRVPVFLELRELNQTQLSLKEFIQNTLHLNNFALDNEYIEKALKVGHFLLLFDGFDELASSLRKTISKELLDLAKSYEKNLICVSSRPDNEFSGWSAFSVFRIRSLNLLQACELIERLPFDSDLKGKFLHELKGGLFNTHESFLSNPLLLSIMLLTYGQSADIPSKLNVFYNQAYEALFQRHDALKGAFQRVRQSKLDIQDFARVFAAFSIQTYDKRMFQMTRSDALDYVEKSKRILQVKFDANDYLLDAEQAVCLLIEDGLLIAFAHRSFQEYFVARFICDSKPEVQEKLIDRYSNHFIMDSVFDLLSEMNPELIERCLIIPRLEHLQKRLKITRKVGITHFLRYLKSEFETIEIRNGNVIGTQKSKPGLSYGSVVSFALRHWGDLIDFKFFTTGTEADFKKYLTEKHDPHRKDVVIKVSELTYRDEIVRDLASSGGFFSIHSLTSVLKLKEALIRKHQEIGATLDEILLS